MRKSERERERESESLEFFYQKILFTFVSGCVGTHAASGMFSLLASGFLTEKDELTDAMQLDRIRPGLVYVSNPRNKCTTVI